MVMAFLVLREKDRAGFWATIVVPEDEGVVVRIVNPSRASSSGSVDPEGVLRKWSFPRDDRLPRI